MANVLIIEDDPAIRRSLGQALVDRGHAVARCATGIEGLARLVETEPSVVLLDLGLPDIDGLRLLPMIRGASTVPVIVITAQDDDALIVRALDAGADDYVVKPFGADQIEARIRAVLRRSEAGGPGAGPVVVGELQIDAATRQVLLAGRAVELSRKEFDLLWVLARRVGEVVTRRELLAEVWQQPYGAADRTVDVHLSWLRRKLGESAARPVYLHTLRGVGVSLRAPAPGA
ncbi:MAG: response regulator transcription factor [Propionibacteriaceae bacterium]|nr:response regulator transcription factor [Propionibacteriaceae bacterium]